jgi:hypothetical protein
MNGDRSELSDKIRQMSDEELLKMLRDDTRQYRPDAIEMAKAEFAKRGLVLFPSARDVKCAKCGQPMEEGFMPDFAQYQLVQPLTWVEGKPDHSFWTGARIGDKRQLNVTAYRCTACGYLEFYAAEDESA